MTEAKRENFFIIVGNQRCGTKYLRDIFMRYTNIYPYGEVFFPDVNITHNFDGHFFYFYKEMIAQDRYNIFFNNPDIFDSIFEKYVSEIIKFSPREKSCFDVKSDCFINVPRLYECIKNLDIKILHLYRRDKIGRALSQAVLHQSFNVENGFNPTRHNDGNAIFVEQDAVYRNILAADGFDNFVRNLYSTEQCLSVCYEDLIAESSSWASIRSFLKFEGDILPQKAFTKRQGLGSVSRVVNYDEIIEYLASKGISN